MTKLMLVEDDATMRSLLKTIFELEGFDVITQQGSGESVICQSILEEMPDILLLDVNLHNANGLEITKYLRENYSDEMKIILSSGMPLRFDSLKAGANDFLLKPFMPDELIEKVIERELAKKGIVRLEHGPPDLIVACLLVTEDGTAVDSERYRYGGTRWPSDRRFDKGTLVIDLVSNHTRAIVWRGIALRIGVNGTLTGKQIDIVVSQILALYPPGE